MTREAARIVVLSELWLDQAGTLESVDAILTGIAVYAMLTAPVPFGIV